MGPELRQDVHVEKLGDGPALATVLERIHLSGLWRLRRLALPLRIVAYTMQTVWLRLFRHRRQTQVGIAVDLVSLPAAFLNALLFGDPYVFLSLELKIKPRDFRGLLTPLAAVTRVAFRRSEAAVIQGLDRFEVLTRHYGWRHHQVHLLANSGGPGTRARPSTAGNVFVDRLGLDPARPLALQAGLVSDTSCCRDLASAFAQIPEWDLVFHEREVRRKDDPYLKAVRELNSVNLSLSLEPLPFDEIDRVFSAATIGLVFYRPAGPDDDNQRFISSSGKLALFLRYSRPLLVGNLPALAEPIREFRCGVAIENPGDPNEIRRGLERIMEQYDEYCRNAWLCFKEHYDFDRQVRPVIKRLDQMWLQRTGAVEAQYGRR
jgi:hypothetical protein